MSAFKTDFRLLHRSVNAAQADLSAGVCWFESLVEEGARQQGSKAARQRVAACLWSIRSPPHRVDGVEQPVRKLHNFLRFGFFLVDVGEAEQLFDL